METVKFDSASVTSHAELVNVTFVGVCQLQDGSSRTMISVVQYAFMVLLYAGGKGTRYSN